MIRLNLPPYKHTFKQIDDKKYIFDRVRKKYLLLTPEEWVRQNFVEYLVQDLGYPATLISIEKAIKVNRTVKRYDIVAHNNQGEPVCLVECKAPDVKITKDVFDQIAVYNLKLNVKYLILTNGINHYCCVMDFNEKKYVFLPNIPAY